MTASAQAPSVVEVRGSRSLQGVFGFRVFKQATETGCLKQKNSKRPTVAHKLPTPPPLNSKEIDAVSFSGCLNPTALNLSPNHQTT